MTFTEILHYRFLGNNVQAYLICLGILLFGLLFKNLVSRLLTKLLYRFVRSKSEGVTEEQFHALLIKPVAVVIFLITIYIAFNILDYPVRSSELSRHEPWYQLAAFRLYQIAVISGLAWVLLRAFDFAVLVFAHRAETFPSSVNNQLIPFARDLIKVLVVLLAFLVMLSKIFAVDVTALIGGLGIGGLAVAFAAKESLENLIASFTIFLDQPFVVGDLVSVGDMTGTIEKIGFRSTRLRTVEKSYVTVPNKSMIDKPLDNLSLRTARRVFFMMSLSHLTTSTQLHSIIDEAYQAINSHPLIEPDAQVKFTSLTPSAKDVRVQYYIRTDSYDEYLNVMEEINFRLVEIVERNGGTFVDTTMTRLSAGNNASPDLPRSLQQNVTGATMASS